MKLFDCFSKHCESLATPVSVEMSPTISRPCKAVPPSACLNTPANDLFATPGSCITETMNTLSYAPALYCQRRHLFSGLRYPNLFNDSSARSCPESFDYLQCFSLYILLFFCGWKKVGAAATLALPTLAMSPCVCGGKESILQEEFNTSKAS